MRMSTVLFVAVLAALALSTRAGELEPPGPPAPTMKSLDEVEARIPIRAADLPLTITSSGSYFLVEGISVAGDGITIASSDVTLDLMGFTLAGGTGTGISSDTGTQGVTVRNGVVTGWSGSGLDLWGASLVVDLHAHDNTADGIKTGTGSVVANCVARDNTEDGFDLGPESTIRNSTAVGNNGNGIHTAARNTVTECTASSNDLDGIHAHGVIRGCIAGLNTGDGIEANHGSQVIDCFTTSNDQHGIRSGSATRIAGNTSRENGTDGIAVTHDVVVINNSCSQNGRLGDGAGIHVLNTFGARVEGNSVFANDRGIYVFRSGNVVVRNVANGNTTSNYDIAAGNAVGAIATDPATAGPWDNIEY